MASNRSIYVSPLAGGNDDGFLRIINDGGITLESEVLVSEALKVSGRLGVGTQDPESIIHARDDSAVETGITVQNHKAGENSRPFINLKGITKGAQGTYVKLQGTSGTEAGGTDGSNDGGLKVITSSGGNGNPRVAMSLTHDAKMGIGTEVPRGRLHVTGVDARSQPLVVDGIVPAFISMTPKARQQPGHATTVLPSKLMATPSTLVRKTKRTREHRVRTRNFLIRNDGQTVIKHKDATGHALKVDNGYISGHVIQSNWSGASWSHNVLFRADQRFTVSQSGPATFSLSRLFDGRMGPDYPGGAFYS